MIRKLSLFLLTLGISIESIPRRYRAVIDFLESVFVILLGSFEKRTSPPSSPALGPKSNRTSAFRRVSSSCSTTTTVFPPSLNVFNEFRSFSLSLLAKPILGSSRT